MIMGLFVPVLRTAMVFLNVWETYKTLKPPPPSRRGGGKPSVRASSQRKRDMKGCMSIWIIWALFATYERTIDGTVRFFIPFYDEFKSILILALILARSRLAEPIFLHVVRPVLKPYVPTIDFVLDHTATVGDLVALLVSIPVEMVTSCFPRSWRANEDATNSQESAFLGEFEHNRKHDAIISPETVPHEGMPSSTGSYQMWHAPTVVEDGTAESVTFANIYKGPPTPPPEQLHPRDSFESQEWRRYSNLPPRFSPTPIPIPPPLASASHHAGLPSSSNPDNDDDDTGYDVRAAAFPWPNPTPLVSTSELPPGFRPSVQQ